jgi:uncharacterized membrane protein YbhN (UPF0104 family)
MRASPSAGAPRAATTPRSAALPASALGRWPRPALVALAAAAGLGGAALTLRDLDPGSLARALGRADLGLLLAGLAAVQAASVAKALRWRAILAPSRPPLGLLVALIFVGQFANNLLPTRAGDLARIELLARAADVDRPAALTTIAAEKLLDLLLLGLLFVALLPGVPALPQLDRPRLLAAAVLGGALLVAIAAGLARAPGLVRGVDARIGRLLARLALGARALRTPRGALQAVGWSLAAWLLGGLANVWTLAALGVDRPWLPGALLLLVLYAGLPIPALPGRIGLHQALALAALAPFALGDGVALGVALVIYLDAIVLPTLLGGAALYWLGRRLGRPSADAATGTTA